jgi:hypothetical protein
VKKDQPPPPDKPTCQLTANPKTAKPGETVVLELTVAGSADYASIDGNSVQFPLGRLNVTKSTKGDYSAVGYVRGTGGSSNCYADYRIEDGIIPPLAEFSITATHCGSNRLSTSGVKSACVAVVKKDPSWVEFTMPRVIMVTYDDESQEVLPLLAFKAIPPAAGATTMKDDMTTYANGLVKGSTYTVADTRKATLTSEISGGVPVAVEGRSSKGRYFLVETLNPFLVMDHLPVVKHTL